MSSPTSEAVQNLLRLQRVHRHANASQRDDIAALADSLRRQVGQTVRKAEAARLLGIRHPALIRWIENGEISTVLTPEGRHEIPLAELLELLEAVETERSHGSRRPLARVLAARNRRADEAVDLDRLLSVEGLPARGHRVAELQALAYHRLVAERLDQELVDTARRRVASWSESGRIHRSWVEAWERILALPIARIAEEISRDTASASELRQTSPFAGALTEPERRRLVNAVKERALA